MLAVFDTYTVVKFFHVLLAIIAVGFNASYGIWVRRAAEEPFGGSSSSTTASRIRPTA